MRKCDREQIRKIKIDKHRDDYFLSDYEKWLLEERRSIKTYEHIPHRERIRNRNDLEIKISKESYRAFKKGKEKKI